MKKYVKNIYQISAIIILIIGLAFSYLVAEMSDAPGLVIIGSLATCSVTLALYGIGEIKDKVNKIFKMLDK